MNVFVLVGIVFWKQPLTTVFVGACEFDPGPVEFDPEPVRFDGSR